MDNSGFVVDSESNKDHNGESPSIYTDTSTPNKSLDTIGDNVDKNGNAARNLETTGDGTVRMKRQIGLVGGTSMIVGTMIGSGIFVAPSGLLQRTESIAMSLCVWAACGVLATFTALSYCELGTVVPRSGGEHAYYMATFAPEDKRLARIVDKRRIFNVVDYLRELPAFLMAWMTILLLKPSSLSIISLSFGQYALSPILTTSGYCDDFKNSAEYDYSRKFLAICIATIIASVNIYSARLATNVQVVFTGAKITAMIVIIAIGVYNFSRGVYGPIGDLAGKFDAPNTDLGVIAMSFYSGLWAYEGWNNLNFVTEELENPGRNLPLSILFAIPLVTVLYLAVNVSYFTVLDKDGLINSAAVAVDVGNEHLGVMKFIIPLLVTLSTIGSANGSMYTAGRISYVAGRDGHMVDILSYVHSTRLTPTIAIALNTVLAIPMIFISDINNLIDFFSFAAWIFYGLALACVVILRFTQPDVPRPFRVPIFIPILAVIVSTFLVLAPIITQPQTEYFYVLGFAFIGILMYTPFVYLKWRLPFMDSFTTGIQKLTNVAPSPFKED